MSVPSPGSVALLADADALALADPAPEVLAELMAAAAARRDRAYGRRLTFSPKVFLPVTNLCRNRCDYCSFRRSPGDAGEWTMTPLEIERALDGGAAAGCVEALFCLGDAADRFASYRRLLASFRQESTVEYLWWAGRAALARGLLPHTNAGLLSAAQMQRLRPVNVSLGLMLESTSARLCEPGMPHRRAPDKRPDARLRMTRQAGELGIPFTSGVLVGIGETPRECVETLLEIRELHRAHGHIQEVIVQCFQPHPDTPMRDQPEPREQAIAATVALARLILPDEVSVQVPPNLTPASLSLLVDAGINDLGGVSPVTPDYINPLHPWPHLGALAATCRALGFELRPRLPIYDAFIDRPGFLADELREAVCAARERLERAPLWAPSGHAVDATP